MTTSVLLCGDRTPAFEPAGWLPGAGVHVVPELCRGPREIGRLGAGATHLVVGVCPEEHSVGAIQTQARKLGLDALGVELIDLSEAARDPDRLRLMTAGAIARARAFAGSRPEHAKLTFPAKVSRRSLFTFSAPGYIAAPDVVPEACAAGVGCQACVDACSRRALTWSKGTIVHDTSVCEPCGRCVAACPTGAMTNPATTPQQLEAQVRALLDPALGPRGPRGIVFSCSRATRAEQDPDWYPIKVSCTGMVTPSWLLAPLLLGAAATAARPCGDAGCPLRNDEHVAAVISFCHSFLGEVGLPADHVRTRTDSSPGTVSWTLPIDDPFGPLAAGVLCSLAEVAGRPAGVTLAHPASPVGVAEIQNEVCTACTMCAQSCPTGALAWETGGGQVELRFDAARCTACGQCLFRCPEAERGAITVSKVTDIEALTGGAQIIFAEDTLKCVSCGRPIAPAKLIERLSNMLGEDGAGTIKTVSRYCVDCRGHFMPTRTD